MASYHCSAKIGGKGSAGKHADYISREGKYSPELTKGTSKLEDLEHTASGNMPTWAEHDAGIFWRAADEYERANGSTYREIEVALPRELTPAQRVALVEDFIAKEIGKNHAFTFAIHKPKAALEGGDQPHCHFMYSERTLDGIDRDPAQYFKRANSKNPERGGCKKASGGKTRDDLKSELLETRKLWATVQNAHLEKYGHTDRVDHRSLKDQGIERQPEAHLGPLVAKQIDATDFIESRRLEHELELAIKAGSSIDVTAELAAQHAAAEQAQREAQAAIAKAAAQAAELAAAQAKRQHLQDLLTATLAKQQEKEDDGIRAAALAAIDGNVRATSQTWGSTFDAIEASRGHLNAGGRVAHGYGPNLGRAIQGAERRVARSHLESSAPAVGKQLGNVNQILQQLVDYFPNIGRTIAAAAQAVARRYLDRIQKVEEAEFQKALQAELKAAQAAEKIPAVQVLDTSAFDKTGLLRSDDVDLVQRAKTLYSQAGSASSDRQMLDQEISKAISEAVSQIRATEPKANNFGVEDTIKTEQNAAARSAGQQEPWKAGESNCTWHVLAAQRQRELDAHTRTQRPSGILNRAAGKEYDDKTAGLTSQIDNIKRAAAKLEAELRARVAEQAQQAIQNGPQHAEAQERHAGLTLLHKAVGEATRQIDANEPQPGKAHGKGTSR